MYVLRVVSDPIDTLSASQMRRSVPTQGTLSAQLAIGQSEVTAESIQIVYWVAYRESDEQVVSPADFWR